MEDDRPHDLDQRRWKAAQIDAVIEQLLRAKRELLGQDDQTPEQRREVIRRFNSRRIKVVAAIAAAAGTVWKWIKANRAEAVAIGLSSGALIGAVIVSTNNASPGRSRADQQPPMSMSTQPVETTGPPISPPTSATSSTTPTAEATSTVPPPMPMPTVVKPTEVPNATATAPTQPAMEPTTAPPTDRTTTEPTTAPAEPTEPVEATTAPAAEPPEGHGGGHEYRPPCLRLGPILICL